MYSPYEIGGQRLVYQNYGGGSPSERAKQRTTDELRSSVTKPSLVVQRTDRGAATEAIAAGLGYGKKPGPGALFTGAADDHVHRTSPTKFVGGGLDRDVRDLEPGLKRVFMMGLAPNKREAYLLQQLKAKGKSRRGPEQRRVR